MSDDAESAGNAEAAIDRPRSRASGRRWEFLVVVVLGLSALATAWSSYQASLWDGIQSRNYTQASGARTDAAQQRSAGNQFRIADLTVFENYIDAVLTGNDEVAQFYRDRFRGEFAVAFNAWQALDPLNDPSAPTTPLAMPEYQLAADAEALRLEERADALFTAGENANRDSDSYTLTTLLFAAALFFAAIADRFDFTRTRIILLSLAAFGLVAGVIIALTQPITTG
jgi:hypothetical protein